MADKFTKTSEPAGLVEDDWKVVKVKKEHQPEKETSLTTYWDMEAELAGIESNITVFSARKTALVAEMAKVKTAVEA
jgi:hypothetical protein